MKRVSGQKLFTYWFGFGLPLILIGALLIAFAYSPYLGGAVLLTLGAWLFDTGRTTCSRCAYYGTAKCGLPGLIAPLLTEKKPANLISQARVRSHLRVDLWILALFNAIYSLEPALLPVALLWSAGVWRISLGPKRYHGLLFRLRIPDTAAAEPERRVPISFV